MKYCIVIALAVAVTLCAAAPDGYSTKYDNVDVDEILKSNRLFNGYYKCLMDNGPCTPDARELKSVLSDALLTNCGKCSEKQKAGTQKVIKYIVKNKPQQWEALRKKYDPDNQFATKYAKEAKALGIAV